MPDTTRGCECNASAPRLVMALELGRRQWTMGFMTRPGGPFRKRQLDVVTNRAALVTEIAAAKRRFGLPADAAVASCYEAGPEGFWVPRWLTDLGVQNQVVDSSSIEVNRRKRRATTDRLDVRKLATMLYRHLQGERDLWRLVRVPSETAEEARQPQRELRALKRDRTRVTNRMGGLLATQGIVLKVGPDFGGRLAARRTWNDAPLPPALHTRLTREWSKVELLTEQIRAVERTRRARLRQPPPVDAATVALVRRLLALRGIGEQGAWLLVTELFGWRQFRNRREVGGLSGLTGTPYRSSTLAHEQGISKAGNAQIRAIAIELAWCWLTYQPQSALAQWYQQRFAHGGPQARKIGIVAVARRLLIDLWRYLDGGVIPDGARFKPDHESAAQDAAA